jgi:hypothetical protein
MTAYPLPQEPECATAESVAGVSSGPDHTNCLNCILIRAAYIRGRQEAALAIADSASLRAELGLGDRSTLPTTVAMTVANGRHCEPVGQTGPISTPPRAGD